MFIHDLCQTKDMAYHVVPWCTMLFHASTSICCFQYLSLNSNYLFMVDHGQTMVRPWTNHGLPWSPTMKNHDQNMVDHGQTMILVPGL